MATKDPGALKRLGGGRWQTRDERFTIEPQGGSWVVVDAEQTDELGLPLVRGPFGSLTAAREAIEGARTDAAPVSPLAARIEAAADRPPLPARPAAPTRPAKGRVAHAVPEPERAPPPPPPPPPPPEPAWIRALRHPARAGARQLIERLEAAGVADAEEIARAAVVDWQPAVARVALRRAITAAAAAGGDPAVVAARVVALLVEGEDPALEVRWHLVDGDGRPIGTLDPGP